MRPSGPYVAPELLQSPGARPTAQSDVYSLGVIFYRLLTGVLPDRDQGNEQPQITAGDQSPGSGRAGGDLLKGNGGRPNRALCHIGRAR